MRRNGKNGKLKNGGVRYATPDALVWEEPKRAHGGDRPGWPQILAPLKAHPKRWARVRAYKNVNSATCTLGQLNRKPALKGFEFTTVGRRLYARYTG